MPVVGYSAALEQFHPTDLLRWCQEAEQALRQSQGSCRTFARESVVRLDHQAPARDDRGCTGSAG